MPCMMSLNVLFLTGYNLNCPKWDSNLGCYQARFGHCHADRDGESIADVYELQAARMLLLSPRAALLGACAPGPPSPSTRCMGASTCFMGDLLDLWF